MRDGVVKNGRREVNPWQEWFLDRLKRRRDENRRSLVAVRT